MESIVISSEKALPPVGPHSQAMRRGSILAIGGQVGNVLNEFLTEPFPARTTVYTQLPTDMLVEIDALAVLE